MTSRTARIPASRTRLPTGQALRLHVDRRTTLVVGKGAVAVISPPVWLGERMVAVRTRLGEGQAFNPSHDGWPRRCLSACARCVDSRSRSRSRLRR
ncbi:MAG: hypothetical protein ACRYGA_14775 [Janthinobacterium lividum]